MHCHMEKEGKVMGTPHIDARFAAYRPHVLCVTLRGGEVLLRLLLHHVLRAMSFKDLMCTNRHLQHPTQHASFKETC